MLWVLIKMPRRGDSNEYQHGEAILMSTHNICFYGELMKIVLLLSNTLLIWSSESDHFVGFVVWQLIA